MFCSSDASHPSVLGVDRTFNLGPCYVTILVYHQNNLIRKGTQYHPIMLGPVYLHWDGLFTTYHPFFSHLQSQFDECICGIQTSGRHLLLGSDEEKALTKAMKQLFPSSHRFLCRRHIEENVKRYLRGKVGASDGQVKEVTRDILGKTVFCLQKMNMNFNCQVSSYRKNILVVCRNSFRISINY